MAPTGSVSDSFSASAEPAHLRVGDVFADRYEILGLAGRGGFSYVFKARDRETGETVALKFLASRDTGQNLIERMRRELRLARDLRHPNIVRVFELHEVQDFYCLAMEFVEGNTLKNLIVSTHPIPVEQAQDLLLQLASAIAAVHAAGVVHRDLKPQNVVVTSARQIKLLDFGLAKTPESTGLTVTGTILGTPDYMAPEQVEGRRADSRSDVYALGVIAYELFVGRPPFQGDTPLSVALQHVRSRVGDPCKSRLGLPPQIGQLVLRMTEPNPAKRPASAQEVLVDLTRAGHAGGISGIGGTRARLKRLAAAGVLAAALAGAAGVTVAVRKGSVGPAARSISPLADGKVIVAVVAPQAANILGARSFVSALVAALEGRLASPSVEVRRLDPARLQGFEPGSASLRALGVEELLRVTLLPGPGGEGVAYRVEAASTGAVGGSGWLPISSTGIRTLDFEAVEVAAEGIASGFTAAVKAALLKVRQQKADEKDLEDLKK
jgi:predicted Ser/Thr protein kinase